MVAGFVLGFLFAAMSATFDPIAGIMWALLTVALLVAGIVVSFATLARRARDAGLGPWWAAALFIPYVSAVVLIVFGCLKSEDPAENG